MKKEERIKYIDRMFNLLSFMDSDAKIIHILFIIKKYIEMNRLRQ